MSSVASPNLGLVLIGAAVLAMLWRLLLKFLVAVLVVVLLFGIFDVTTWITGLDLGAGFATSDATRGIDGAPQSPPRQP